MATVHRPKALLAYQYVSFETLMATDRGSGAKSDLATWRPELPNGWYYLGQAASSDYGTIPKSVIVKELQSNVLKDVAKWEQVWTDKGSGKPTDFALWRGIPPSDEYVVVGGIFSTNPSWAHPNDDQTRGIKAVRKDALSMYNGSTGTAMLFPVWTDKGTGAVQNGSAWTVVPIFDNARSEVGYPLSMIPAVDDNDWKPPPAESCYMLSADRTVNVGKSIDIRRYLGIGSTLNVGGA